MLLIWLLACTVHPYTRPVEPPVAPAAGAGGGASSNASITAALAHADRLLALTDDVDRRDRLVELHDLLLGVQLAEPRVQDRVARYAERELAIEERSAPIQVVENAMEMATSLEAVQEETVGAADPLAVARAAMAGGRIPEALAAFDEAIAAAKALPAGPDREQALAPVAEALKSALTAATDPVLVAGLRSRQEIVASLQAKP